MYPEGPAMERAQLSANRRLDVARLGIAAAAALLFAVVAHDVRTQGPLSALDERGLAWLSTLRNVFLDHLMTWTSLSGGPSATCVYATVLIIVSLMRRQAARALATGAIVYGAAALNVAVKELVHRGRPVFDDPLMMLQTFSFPSGHAAASTVFGGLTCLLVWRSRIPRGYALIAVILTITWVGLVCVSRAYLNVHFPTDIVAGVSEGMCWLALATLATDRLGVKL